MDSHKERQSSAQFYQLYSQRFSVSSSAPFQFQGTSRLLEDKLITRNPITSVPLAPFPSDWRVGATHSKQNLPVDKAQDFPEISPFSFSYSAWFPFPGIQVPLGDLLTVSSPFHFFPTLIDLRLARWHKYKFLITHRVFSPKINLNVRTLYSTIFNKALRRLIM